MWRQKSTISYPFLQEKPEGGSGVSQALFNWLLIIGVLVLGLPYIKMFIPNLNKPIEEVRDIQAEMSKMVVQTLSANESIRQYAIGENNNITPTVTPIPQVIEPEIITYEFLYSYYYPDLGGVNCHEANWNGYSCRDITASGKTWRDKIGKGIALHPNILNNLPYGTMVRVTEPESIKGDYEVIDMCPGCGFRDIGGLYYIDFLDNNQKLPWSTKIKLEVIQ